MTILPLSRCRTTWSCFGILGALAMEGAGSRRLARPRCGTSRTFRDGRSASSPSSSSNRRYFARRVSADDPPSRQALAEAGREWKTDVAPPQLDAFRCGRRPSPARGRAGRSRPRAVQALRWSRMTARNAAPYFCSLTAPTPCRPARPSSVSRARLRHFDQGAIREDDIGRLLLRRRDRSAQAFQRRKQPGVRLRAARQS